jgi:hypothetical protein
MPAPSDILSDPEIAQAYEDVRSDKSETTWLVLKYTSAINDELKLDGTGTGGIGEMCAALGDDEAAYAVRCYLAILERFKQMRLRSWACVDLTRAEYGSADAKKQYVRCKLGNDEYSERTKFVFVVWAGEFRLNSFTIYILVATVTVLKRSTSAKELCRTPDQSHEKGQDELSVWTGQAGDPDVCD